MAAGGGAHDVGVIFWFGEIGLHGFTKEFVVTVSTKTFCKSSGLCTKEVESIANVSDTKSFQCEHPIIPGCSVDKHQIISFSSDGHYVTKTYVDMDLVELAILGAINVLSSR